MSDYRHNLPQLGTDIFLTDGGLETTLVFQDGHELPYFAAFEFLRTAEKRDILRRYYETYLVMAVNAHTGFILESPTWRANPDWAARMGIASDELDRINRLSIEFLGELRDEYEVENCPIVVSGCVGPRGDGYVVSERMSADLARDYHGEQIASFAATEADMVAALTINYVDEAIGIARAARESGIPVVISFTTETDGRLPDGNTLGDAIYAVDEATDAAPAYYMINCAHPDHFAPALAAGESWLKRIGGVRANASRKSHAELDNSDELDIGNPEEFGQQYRALREQFPHFNVLGGCCGTDHRHLGQVCRSCVV